MQEQTTQPQSQSPIPKAEKKNKRGASAGEDLNGSEESVFETDGAGPGLFYGNLDTEKKYKLPEDWQKHVCVHQCQIQSLNGGVVEVPNTHTLQTYAPEQFDKNSDDSKGASFFSENKMKVVVLHDPRRK